MQPYHKEGKPRQLCLKTTIKIIFRDIYIGMIT